jgi:hypothetical protein
MRVYPQTFPLNGGLNVLFLICSVDFAKFVLQHAHLHSGECIFDFEKLKQQHILELG